MDFLGYQTGVFAMPFYLLDFTVQKSILALRSVWGVLAAMCSRLDENRDPKSLRFFGWGSGRRDVRGLRIGLFEGLGMW